MFLGATVVYTGRWAEAWIMLVLALKLNPASFPPMILNPKGSLSVFRRTKLWISFISGGLSRRGGKMYELENEIQIRKVARAHFPTFEFPRARPTEFNSHSPSGFRFRAQTEFTARERETQWSLSLLPNDDPVSAREFLENAHISKRLWMENALSAALIPTST